MRKRTVFIFFTLLIVCLLNAGLALSSNAVALGKGDSIKLTGDLPDIGPRSLSCPIDLFQHSGYLEAVFNLDLGTITVQIADAMNGLVYDDVIDTSVEPYTFIDTRNFDTGTYSIRFTNLNGEFLWGEFVIE